MRKRRKSTKVTIALNGRIWEVKERGEVVESFALKPFEGPNDSLGIIKAINYVRKNYYNNATYFDFSELIIRK